jgi:hypothetical protein
VLQISKFQVPATSVSLMPGSPTGVINSLINISAGDDVNKIDALVVAVILIIGLRS